MVRWFSSLRRLATVIITHCVNYVIYLLLCAFYKSTREYILLDMDNLLPYFKAKMSAPKCFSMKVDYYRLMFTDVNANFTDYSVSLLRFLHLTVWTKVSTM